jgi:hypothetical protein
MLRDAKPYAERLFQYRDLDRLPPPAARSALITPAARHGVTYEETAARLIIEESGGYPYFIQEYGRVLWREVDDSPITLDAVQSVRDLIVNELDRRFFKDRFESASDGEQRYLALMAQLPQAPYRTADIAKAGYRTRGSASEPRESLLRKDLIWSPRRGLVDFTVPHFAEYITRNHPLSDFDS